MKRTVARGARAWLARRAAPLLLVVTAAGTAAGGVAWLAGAAGTADVVWLGVAVCGLAYACWVAAAVDKLTAAGVKAHGDLGHTIFGYAARSIVDDAIEHDVDVIVMGSRGRGDLAGLVLGSTAHKVIHLADRPVLIVR